MLRDASRGRKERKTTTPGTTTVTNMWPSPSLSVHGRSRLTWSSDESECSGSSATCPVLHHSAYVFILHYPACTWPSTHAARWSDERRRSRKASVLEKFSTSEKKAISDRFVFSYITFEFFFFPFYPPTLVFPVCGVDCF